jgi:hypothetical protein
MKDVELNDEAIIDLGQASAETKGPGVIASDGSGGKLNFVSGIAED